MFFGIYSYMLFQMSACKMLHTRNFVRTVFKKLEGTLIATDILQRKSCRLLEWFGQ